MPYNVDVVFERYPIANWVLIPVTCVISTLAFPAITAGIAPLKHWMLYGAPPWNADIGLLGSMFTHGDLSHLLGNMVFLFVFGNAVNAKLGHWLYIALYIAFGVIASLASAATSTVPSLGASGAISGITGLFIILFTQNRVQIFYWLGFHFSGSFDCPAWLVVLLYFLKDVLFYVLELSTGTFGGVGYVAHITGTLAGVAVGLALLMTERTLPNEDEITAVEVLGWKKY